MAKAAGEKPPKKSFGGFLFRLAVIGAAGYLAVSVVAGQMQVAALERKEASLAGQLELQREKNAELQRLSAGSDGDAYAERTARAKLNYADPKERVFIDLTGE